MAAQKWRPGRPTLEASAERATERARVEAIEKRAASNRLEDGSFARGVPADFDFSQPLPDERWERFAQLIADGSTPSSAVQTVTKKKLKTPIQSGARLKENPAIQRRVRWLQQHKAEMLSSEQGLKIGFEAAVTRAVHVISELVQLCVQEGFHRQASQARRALSSVSGKLGTHRKTLEQADKRGRVTSTRAKTLLMEILDEA